ncbi:MAG: hypothetical protein ABIP33_06300 [Pseudolysinimonas sp.]
MTELPSDRALTAFLAALTPEAVQLAPERLAALRRELTLLHDTVELRRRAYQHRTEVLERSLHKRIRTFYTFTDRQLQIAIAALEAQERNGGPLTYDNAAQLLGAA